MAISQFNLQNGQYAQRKELITVAEWTEGTGNEATQEREILGTRTESSSIEYNNDTTTTTDIRGINYTDLNKTQPQQTFDPFLVIGGSKLGAKLNDLRRRNALNEFNQFTIYVITKYVGSAGAYEAECHTGCSIFITSLGGDTKVNMPIEVHLSNDYNGSGAPGLGTVDKIASDFVFTPAVQG